MEKSHKIQKRLWTGFFYILTTIGFLVAVMLFLVPFLIYYGWAWKLMWNWFISPLGIRMITLWESVGIVVFVRFCFLDTNRLFDVVNSKKWKRQATWKKLIPALSVPICSVLLGLFVKFFI
jgi:hypothetical protein